MLVRLCYVLMSGVHGPRLGRSQGGLPANDALTPYRRNRDGTKWSGCPRSPEIEQRDISKYAWKCALENVAGY